MDKDGIKNMVEAVLFVTGDPVSVANLAALSGVDFDEFDQILTTLIEEKKERTEGILIRRVSDKVQLCSNAEYAKYIQMLLAPEIKGHLSNSLLETLSINCV